MRDSSRVRERLAVLVDPAWPDIQSAEGGRHAAGDEIPSRQPVAPEQPEEQDEAESAPPGRGPIGLIRRQVRGPWGRLARRWVPEPLRDSRVDPGRRGAVVLTVIAALAAVIAAVGVWRARPEPRPVQAAAVSALSAGLVAGPPPAATVSTGRPPPTSGARISTDAATRPAVTSTALVVSVTGRVARPGLVRLPAGARVADAIAAAGGADSGAVLTGLNLAQPLQDGQSVVVLGGAAPPAGGSTVAGGDSSAAGTGLPGAAAPAGTGVAGPPVDLNSADAQVLDALPGVGPVTAAAIVAWRERNGRFTSVDQLQEIAGIGPAKFGRLAPLVRV